MSSVAAREHQKEAVVSAALALIAKQPFAAFSREAVCQASGLKYSTVRSYFPDAEVLIRLAAARLFSAVHLRLCTDERRSPNSVQAAISAYVDSVGRLLDSPEYEQLMRILVREGEAYPWLIELYREQVSDTFERRLSRRIRAAGESYDAHLMLQEGAARAALQQLEAALVLPKLLPAGVATSHEPQPDLLASVARSIMAATYAWELPATIAA